MTYAVVYSSRTGNTRLLAETIREQLPAGDCLYFGAPSPEALKAEMIFCGFWTDKGTCDENVASFLGSLKQQRVFLFGTAGFGGDPAYFEKILNTVKQCLSPSVSLCGGFLCQGKMPEEVRRRFVSDASHELKTPLTSISGYAELIETGIAKPEDIRGFATRIRKESARLRAMPWPARSWRRKAPKSTA